MNSKQVQPFAVLETTTPYDAVAQHYDELVRQGRLIHDIVLPPLLRLVGEVAGLQVLDLACGTGVVARALAEHGAQVVGVDLSEPMLALARQYETTTPLGIRYVQDDAQTLARFQAASIDLVTCCLAITDIPDFAALTTAVSRVLRPGGCFAWVVPHPCFQAPGSRWLRVNDQQTFALAGGYFNEGYWVSSTQFSGRLGAYHRTLTTLLNTLAGAGLRYEFGAEPRAHLDEKPGYREAAVALLVRCRKEQEESHGKG
ncbi:MAG TPA: class I SAM-dependent methyltransferase [Ktedonobacterales bacterium]|nr:class I SAM-dependent methyltransferase [Ktedonobacterales bacterium]